MSGDQNGSLYTQRLVVSSYQQPGQEQEKSPAAEKKKLLIKTGLEIKGKNSDPLLGTLVY